MLTQLRVIVDTKETEIKRLLSVHNDPAAAARARSRLLAPEQQLQQRKLRKAFTRIEKTIKEAEHSATLLKAKTAARDRHRVTAKVQPPTAEAVRNTIMKLTAMVERKNGDVEYLEEKLRRMRLGSRARSVSLTPGRFDTPERSTPERSVRDTSVSITGPSAVAPTPVLAVVEKDDVEEMKEEQRRRREVGRRFRGALAARGGKARDRG
jgi:nucleoporin NUP159